jgi:aryl-alcohol dehydrogenase-like predicted oxidoreductase
MQNEHSLTYREEEREMNAYCNFTGIGLIPWGPLNGGFLARPVDAQATSRSQGTEKPFIPRGWQEEIIRRVEKVANDKGWKMSQVALAWINGKVTSPIVGFSSVSISSHGVDCILTS